MTEKNHDIDKRKGAACSHAKRNESIHRSDLTGLRVLVADDSPDICRLFEYYLKKSHASVESVQNGRECILRVLDAELPSVHLVLMDLNMPVMDGSAALAGIRDGGGGMPIYATSAISIDEIRRGVDRAGFTGFIAKPIDPDHLLEIATLVFAEFKGQSEAA